MNVPAMSDPDGLDAVARLVRRHDPDRFFTALFVPPTHRPALLALYAFNHELARAREVAHEPTLALIRLQWWREVVQGAPRRHEVATPLAAALAQGALRAADLLAMVDAREAETDWIASLSDWQDFVLGAAGAVALAAGRALGADDAAMSRLRELGAAYGVAGQLRNVSAYARQGRCLLPLDRLAAHGLSAEQVIAQPNLEQLAPVLAELAGWGRGLLRAGRGAWPRRIVAAALPAVLARRDLRRPAMPAGPRGFGDKAAVLAAYARGRVC